MRNYNVINTICTVAANDGAVETMCTLYLRSRKANSFFTYNFMVICVYNSTWKKVKKMIFF